MKAEVDAIVGLIKELVGDKTDRVPEAIEEFEALA